MENLAKCLLVPSGSWHLRGAVYLHPGHLSKKFLLHKVILKQNLLFSCVLYCRLDRLLNLCRLMLNEKERGINLVTLWKISILLLLVPGTANH